MRRPAFAATTVYIVAGGRRVGEQARSRNFLSQRIEGREVDCGTAACAERGG